MQLDTIQQEIANLPPEAQQIIFDLVSILKNRYTTPKVDNADQDSLHQTPDQNDWSDFIGCVEAESDLSSNYKTYLGESLANKYDHR